MRVHSSGGVDVRYDVNPSAQWSDDAPEARVGKHIGGAEDSVHVLTPLRIVWTVPSVDPAAATDTLSCAITEEKNAQAQRRRREAKRLSLIHI